MYNTGPRKWRGSFPKPEKKEKAAPQPLSRKPKTKKVTHEVPGAQSLTQFFNEQRERMTGICAECGGKTSKYNDQTFHFSICHIFPKKASKFPSVATHPDNWIELCAFGEKSCHSRMDHSLEKMQQMKIWPELVRRFKLFYHSIKEKSKIPDCFLQELEPDEL